MFASLARSSQFYVASKNVDSEFVVSENFVTGQLDLRGVAVPTDQMISYRSLMDN